MAKRLTKSKSRPAGKKKSLSVKKIGSSKSGSRQKLFWVAGAYLALMLAGNYFFFSTKVVKQFMVHETFHFSGTEKKCGVFTSGDITSDGKDKFALTDTKNMRVLTFGINGGYLGSAGKQGKDSQDFTSTVGITSDDNGNLYIIDWSGVVHVVGADGKLAPTISLAKVGTYGPRGICWDGNNLLIADTGDHRILKISLNGDLIEKWGDQGDCETCFKNPSGMAADHKGNIYVADFDNNRVVWSDTHGKVKKIIDIGTRPNDVAVDPNGNLYVSSAEGGFIKVFNQSGKLIGPLKEDQNNDGFSNVQGLGMMEDGTLLVAEGDSVAACKPVLQK